MTRRPFTTTVHDDGLIVTAGNRSLRLSAAEVDDLTAMLASPIIEREIARLCGLES